VFFQSIAPKRLFFAGTRSVDRKRSWRTPHNRTSSRVKQKSPKIFDTAVRGVCGAVSACALVLASCCVVVLARLVVFKMRPGILLQLCFVAARGELVYAHFVQQDEISLFAFSYDPTRDTNSMPRAPASTGRHSQAMTQQQFRGTKQLKRPW